MLHQLIERVGLSAHLDAPMERAGAFGERQKRHQTRHRHAAGRGDGQRQSLLTPPTDRRRRRRRCCPSAAALLPTPPPQPCSCWFWTASSPMAPCVSSCSVHSTRTTCASRKHAASCRRWGWRVGGCAGVLGWGGRRAAESHGENEGNWSAAVSCLSSICPPACPPARNMHLLPPLPPQLAAKLVGMIFLAAVFPPTFQALASGELTAGHRFLAATPVSQRMCEIGAGYFLYDIFICIFKYGGGCCRLGWVGVGQGRTGQDRAGQGRAGRDMAEWCRTRQGRMGVCLRSPARCL